MAIAAAGAAAGLLAGGIAATFFALQCTSDSPLFVAVWYTLAIAGLAAIGAVSAKAMARWQRFLSEAIPLADGKILVPQLWMLKGTRTQDSTG